MAPLRVNQGLQKKKLVYNSLWLADHLSLLLLLLLLFIPFCLWISHWIMHHFVSCSLDKELYANLETSAAVHRVVYASRRAHVTSLFQELDQLPICFWALVLNLKAYMAIWEAASSQLLLSIPSCSAEEICSRSCVLKKNSTLPDSYMHVQLWLMPTRTLFP